MVQNLDYIARAYGRQGPRPVQGARAIRARIENTRMDDIFKQGLHEFIDEFIDDNNELGAAISEQYLMSEDADRSRCGLAALRSSIPLARRRVFGENGCIVRLRGRGGFR